MFTTVAVGRNGESSSQFKRPVHRNLSFLAALFSLWGCAIGAFTPGFLSEAMLSVSLLLIFVDEVQS